jgi:hypothetical protein
MQRFTLLFALVGLCLTSGLAQETSTSNAVAVPHLVRFSGLVKDAAGQPLSGTVGITFALYRDQEGGAPLWLETQNVATDNNGHYTVSLGATKVDGLPVELFTSGEARWLGVQPDGHSEQLRVLLLSVPYALKAADAETVGGLPPSAFVLASGAEAGGAATKSARDWERFPPQSKNCSPEATLEKLMGSKIKLPVTAWVVIWQPPVMGLVP